MTAEKLIILVFTLLLFIICVSIFVKTSARTNDKHIFSSLMGSMGLGGISLLTVWLLQTVCGKLISINLCTIVISLLGSLPAVAAMLFLNII